MPPSPSTPTPLALLPASSSPFFLDDVDVAYPLLELFDAGVFTNPVVPPAVPEGSCRLRTSYMATHTDEQLDFVLEQLARVGKKYGVLGHGVEVA